MKNRKGQGFLGLAIVLAAIAVFAYVGYISLPQIKLGLDLAGGVSITYQTLVEDPSAEDMSDTIYKLQERATEKSSEAQVYREGSNRINIDIPGVSDANAILAELGRPGSLYFADETGATVLTGDQVAHAEAGIIEGQGGGRSYVVSLTLTEEGAKAFADATAANIGKPIFIVYDGKIISYPTVRQAITEGKAQIDGMESFEAASDLASFIRIGSLSLELEELRSNVVGAKLGQDAIASSLKAAAVGFAVLALFMLAVYLLPGLAAVLALMVYVGLMLCLLAAFNTEITLTLPGIAGIILSIGMAVDANVIIFTRIKEEIGEGRGVEAAVQTGFKKALSAIIDGNITTLIAAFVLYLRGSGTVKGFATTLGLGILLSMFTALFVTRFTLQSLIKLGFVNPKFFGKKRDGRVIHFIGRRYIYMAVSAVLLLGGVVGMTRNSRDLGGLFHYGIDFKGGTSTNVTFLEDMSLEAISARVVPVVESITKEAGTQTQKVEGTTEVIIKTRSLNLQEREALSEALIDNFGVDGEKITAESISAAVSDEMRTDALVATIISTLAMLVYIWIRFKDIKFALSSVLALVHDVMVVIAVYALLRWSVGSTFIACILTIVGYSINATIVIFDRIRENQTVLPRNTSREELINISVTQTLTRSINASLTTFVMLLILYIFGVSSIREFALPLMVGIVLGTYSSVCLAGALWYMMGRFWGKKRAVAVKEEPRAKKAGKKKD